MPGRPASVGASDLLKPLFLAAASILGTALFIPAAAQQPPAPADRPATFAGMSADAFAAYIDAFHAMERDEWRRALALAADGGHPLAAKIVRWSYYVRGDDDGPRFEEIARFITDNPAWPYQTLLQRRAELAIDESVTDARVIGWFKERDPLTGEGRMRLGAALIRDGQPAKGLEWLRHGWITGNFPPSTAETLLRRHRVHLREADHIARLDRLLWDGYTGAARRMLPLVPRGWQALARARIALMLMRPGVDALIARVPDALLDDPGLAYERARWRRRKDLDESAREILRDPPEDPGIRVERWWTERRFHARELLEAGQPQAAYSLVVGHRQTDGLPLAEAEFLAGWIAQSFLGRHDLAYRHFTRLYESVSMPISLARGAYWSGRAAAAGGRGEVAQRWYLAAAQYPTTFYGQLAKKLAGAGRVWALPPDPVPTAQDEAWFARQELARAAELLAALGQGAELSPFLLRMSELAPTDGTQVLVGRLAERVRRPDVAVQFAKFSERTGTSLIASAYPVVRTVASAGEVERALLLAIARQESEFDASAHSRAGAQGLMQLMPGTARAMARRLGIGYRESRLTADPGYNVRLGAAYLKALIERFDGSYVLATAAYNAGPARVDRWIEQFGDPRKRATDPVDWIESIPFRETRNYVQRAMEGLQVYRQRLANRPLRLTPYADLRRIVPGSS